MSDYSEAWIAGFQDAYLFNGDNRHIYKTKYTANEYWDYVEGYNAGLKAVMAK